MKKPFVKISAFLLTLVLAFGCCFAFSVSATGEPTITVIGNNDEPAQVGATGVTIKLSGRNLDSVKGMDLTLNAPEGASFSAMTGAFTNDGSTRITLTQNTNYTLTYSKIRIVATFVKNPVDTLSADITLTVPNTMGKTTLSLGDVTLVNGSVAKIANNGFYKYNGELIVGKTAPATPTVGSSLPELTTAALESENAFVPYGGIYVDNGGGSYTYPKKNANGSFKINNSSTYNYKKFKLPTNTGLVTTFSYSKRAENIVYEEPNGIQFVSYALDRSQEHGTVLFKGDFNALFEDKKASYPTKQALVQHYADALMDKASGQWYKITLSDDSCIAACRVNQVKAMWSDSDNESGHIQYALRVRSVKDAEEFTAVGYTRATSTTCYVSDEYQSVVF